MSYRMRLFRVWYRQQPHSDGRFFQEDENLTTKNITETHVVLTKDEFKSLDHAFSYMQGEVWNPNGAANGWVSHLGLNHASMSVGDVLEDCNTGEYFQCASIGWSPVPGE